MKSYDVLSTWSVYPESFCVVFVINSCLWGSQMCRGSPAPDFGVRVFVRGHTVVSGGPADVELVGWYMVIYLCNSFISMVSLYL